MTECQKSCEAGSVVYDMEEKAHLRITDKVEKICHPELCNRLSLYSQLEFVFLF